MYTLKIKFLQITRPPLWPPWKFNLCLCCGMDKDSLWKLAEFYTHTHTHTHGCILAQPILCLILSFLKIIGKKLPSCQDEVMGNNSCGSQKHKSLSLMWCLSIPGKPRWAVAAVCIGYSGFTEALDVLPCGILIRRSRKFILHSVTVRWMRTWLEAPFQWRLAPWPRLVISTWVNGVEVGTAVTEWDLPCSGFQSIRAGTC